MNTLLSLAVVASFFLVLAVALGLVLWLGNRLRDAHAPQPNAARVQPRVEREAVRDRRSSPRMASVVEHARRDPSSGATHPQSLPQSDHDAVTVPQARGGADGEGPLQGG